MLIKLNLDKRKRLKVQYKHHTSAKSSREGKNRESKKEIQYFEVMRQGKDKGEIKGQKARKDMRMKLKIKKKNSLSMENDSVMKGRMTART